MNEQILDKILIEVLDVKEQLKDKPCREEIDKRFDEIDKRFGSLDDQVDSLAIKVVSIEEKLETYATRDEMNEKFDLVLNNIDRFVKLCETLDTELSFLRHKYSRLEERLELVERKLQLV